jgi:hypothetical protein
MPVIRNPRTGSTRKSSKGTSLTPYPVGIINGHYLKTINVVDPNFANQRFVHISDFHFMGICFCSALNLKLSAC